MTKWETRGECLPTGGQVHVKMTAWKRVPANRDGDPVDAIAAMMAEAPPLNPPSHRRFRCPTTSHAQPEGREGRAHHTRAGAMFRAPAQARCRYAA